MASIGRIAGLAVLGAAGAAAIAAPVGPTFLEAGYLTLVDVVAPAPIPDEPRGKADHDVYQLTRALKGTPRWTMATADSTTDTATLMRAFACATRIAMTPANAPKTAALLVKASNDVVREAEELRSYYKRQRPFLREKGEICVAQTPELTMTYDYPSTGAARGWAWALILSELVDDRAGPILARGRAFGESRAVCGTNSLSAVEAGRTVAGSTLAVVRTEPPFLDGVAAARKELAALRQVAAPPSAQTCSDEELLVTQPVFR